MKSCDVYKKLRHAITRVHLNEIKDELSLRADNPDDWARDSVDDAQHDLDLLNSKGMLKGQKK